MLLREKKGTLRRCRAWSLIKLVGGPCAHTTSKMPEKVVGERRWFCKIIVLEHLPDIFLGELSPKNRMKTLRCFEVIWQI